MTEELPLLEERLDKILLDRGLVTSRAKAEALIRQGDVAVSGKMVDKPGKKFALDVAIELLSPVSTWVSRGSHKLLAAIEHWSIVVANKDWLDIGASTGGFTQVLLSQNAKSVTCIDVGYGQMHETVLSDVRVTNYEKTHVRELSNTHVPVPVNGCVVDVSFISLTKVVPFISPFLVEGGELILLVKPQFEVGKKFLNKRGVVKQASQYDVVLKEIGTMVEESQFTQIGLIPSPILGGDGNREFLMYLKKK